MKITDAKIGQEVVKVSGNNQQVVSTVTEIDLERQTIRTSFGWKAKSETFEPTSIPYKFIGEFKVCNKTGRKSFPKYKVL